MNEQAILSDREISLAIAHFLKSVSANAQRELEKAVRGAVARGTLRGGEALTTGVTLSNKELGLDITIFSKIEL